jgi:putative ABC transport system permease protein
LPNLPVSGAIAIPFTSFNPMLKEKPLAWSQLIHKKGRLLAAFAGIAFADILIFMQLGLVALLFDGVTRTHEAINGDVFLMSARSKFLGDTAFAREHLFQAGAVDGVASASPLYYGSASWVNPENQERNDVSIIAFDPSQPVLNLPEVNQQLEDIRLPDVVLYDRLSQSLLGPVPDLLTQQDSVVTEVAERRISVVGLFTLGSTLFKSGHIVTSDWNYLRLMGNIDEVQVGVLTLEPGSNLEQVIFDLENRLPKDVKVFSREAFIAHEQAFWAQEPAGVIFNFGAAMGFVVGVVVVYQILYSDVTDHLAEYATLKAMGYSNLYLLSVIFQEALILAVFGFIPGVGFSVGMYALLSALTRIPLYMKASVALQVFLLTLLMCIVSGAVASRKLQAADPADVF